MVKFQTFAHSPSGIDCVSCPTQPESVTAFTVMQCELFWCYKWITLITLTHNESHRKREFVRALPPPARTHTHTRIHAHTNTQTHTHTHSTSVLLLLCSPVDRPGVLVLEVLEVQEECSMQLALCEHQRPPGEGHQHESPVSEERARMLVLFNRETAAQLLPAPRDIIHIYPPWWEDAIHDAH